MLPLHPAIVHIPLGLALAVPVVLVALTVALFRKKAPPRVLWIAALLQAMVLGGALVALATGNADESRVEAAVAETALDRHEDLAMAFVVAAAVSLVITLAAAVMRERWARSFAVASTATSAGVLALGIAVGHAGANLVYRDGAATAYATGGGAPNRAESPRIVAGDGD